jgi:hypothetical protein
VEEQFYLVFPVAIYWIAKRKQNLGNWLGAAALLSFGLSVWTSRRYPDAAFYLAPSRAWEFLLGSMLAVGAVAPPRNEVLRWTAVVFGVALILIAGFSFTEATPFPGENALVPCLGAALSIWAFSGTEGRPVKGPVEHVMVFFGRISYSLYLWHWPLFVFYQRFLGPLPGPTELTRTETLLLFAAAVLISYVSYRCVEQPIRNRTFAGTRRLLFGMAGAASAILLAVGIAGTASRGFPMRVDPQIAAIAEYSRYPIDELYERGTCFLFREQTFGDLKGNCVTLAPGAKNLLVWGDSVAAHYVYGLREQAAQSGLHVLHASSSACPPIFDFDRPNRPNCRAFNEGIRSLIAARRPDAVILSAAWTVLIDEFGYDAILASLRRTVLEIARHGVPVILMGPAIQYTDRLPYILAHFALSGLDRFDSSKFVDRRIFGIDLRMKNDLADLKQLTFVSVLGAVCSDNECPAVIDGMIPMQWDFHHLTKQGSRFVASRIFPTIFDATVRRE